MGCLVRGRLQAQTRPKSILATTNGKRQFAQWAAHWVAWWGEDCRPRQGPRVFWTTFKCDRLIENRMVRPVWRFNRSDSKPIRSPFWLKGWIGPDQCLVDSSFDSKLVRSPFRLKGWTGPNQCPVDGWTGRTDRSGPVFKTLVVTNLFSQF